MIEEFKYYKGQKVIYEVSNLGRVKRNGKIFEPKPINNGYLTFCGTLVHRAVAELFIPNEENKQCVDHIDCNKHNNSVDNLRWCTYTENMLNPITRKHNSDIQKKVQAGEKNGMYGKHHSEETRNLIKIKAIGRQGSNLGRKFSDEWCNNISKARTGTHLSPESLAKRREKMRLKKLAS